MKKKKKKIHDLSLNRLHKSSSFSSLFFVYVYGKSLNKSRSLEARRVRTVCISDENLSEWSEKDWERINLFTQSEVRLESRRTSGETADVISLVQYRRHAKQKEKYGIFSVQWAIKAIIWEPLFGGECASAIRRWTGLDNGCYCGTIGKRSVEKSRRKCWGLKQSKRINPHQKSRSIQS